MADSPGLMSVTIGPIGSRLGQFPLMGFLDDLRGKRLFARGDVFRDSPKDGLADKRAKDHANHSSNNGRPRVHADPHSLAQ